MIDLKKYNYFTGDPKSIVFAVNHIVKFLEMDNYNPLLISSSDSTGLCHLIKGNYNFDSYDEFREIVTNKSKLFRVNLLIFDFYYFRGFGEYRKLIEDLNITSIIILPYTLKGASIDELFNSKIISNADVNYYEVSSNLNTNFGGFNVSQLKQTIKESSFANLDNYTLTDKINNTSASLQAYKTSYIRDKKIDNIFGD